MSGVGFISGVDVRMAFKPAEANTGRVFVRADLPERTVIEAHVSNVAKRSRRTSLRNGSAAVEMVEHVLAALGALQIDNCIVEITGPETPGLDGSSQPVVECLLEAGRTPQDAERKVFRLEEPVYVSDGDATLVAYPDPQGRFLVSYHLDYGPDSPIQTQTLVLEITPDHFIHELAASRTFLLEQEAAELQRQGLGARTTAKDLLIFGPDGVIDNTLRFEDECVRHKILDIVGDMALLNRDFHGHINAYKSGHSLNSRLLRDLTRRIAQQEGQARLGQEPVMDINRITKILPHRYPFLLIDRVIEIEGETRAVGIKNVTYNEPYFQGHWPSRPIMPGVLQVEAMAQLAGVLLSRRLEHTGQLALILSMNNVKIRRPVVPGDQLRIEVETIRMRTRTAHVVGKAMVGDKIASEAHLRFILVDADPA